MSTFFEVIGMLAVGAVVGFLVLLILGVIQISKINIDED